MYIRHLVVNDDQNPVILTCNSTSSNTGQDDDADEQQQPPISVKKPLRFHSNHHLTTFVHLD